MNQARKFNFKTQVEKLNPTSRTDLSNKTLHSILYWKLLFKPFPYKSFGWCNAHSVQADALWGRSFKFQMKTHHKINTSLLMLREWTYTASSRDALGNTSPSALEISLGRGFCTPRPSRFPSGFALGKSLGPRGAKSTPLGNLSGLGGCISQYIPPLGSVRIQYRCNNKNLNIYILWNQLYPYWRHLEVAK